MIDAAAFLPHDGQIAQAKHVPSHLPPEEELIQLERTEILCLI